MKTWQFWTLFGAGVVGLLSTLAVFSFFALAYLTVISASQVCESVQVTEHRSVTQCSLRP